MCGQRETNAGTTPRMCVRVWGGGTGCVCVCGGGQRLPSAHAACWPPLLRLRVRRTRGSSDSYPSRAPPRNWRPELHETPSSPPRRILFFPPPSSPPAWPSSPTWSTVRKVRGSTAFRMAPTARPTAWYICGEVACACVRVHTTTKGTMCVLSLLCSRACHCTCGGLKTAAEPSHACMHAAHSGMIRQGLAAPACLLLLHAAACLIISAPHLHEVRVEGKAPRRKLELLAGGVVLGALQGAWPGGGGERGSAGQVLYASSAPVPAACAGRVATTNERRWRKQGRRGVMTLQTLHIYTSLSAYAIRYTRPRH